MMWNELLLALALSCWATSLFAQVKPGLWEMQTYTEFGDVPARSPIVSRYCIAPDQVESPAQWTPRNIKGARCAVRDYVLKGDEATWSLHCESEPPMQGTGRLRVGAEHYEGSNRVELRRGAESMLMTQRYAARRVGECIEESKPQ